MYILSYNIPYKDLDMAMEKLQIHNIYNVFYESPLEITTDDYGYGYIEKDDENITLKVAMDDTEGELNEFIELVDSILGVKHIALEENNTDYTIAYIELTFTRKDMVLDDSNSDINIYQWSSNDMAKKTAKPNFDCVVVNSDDNAYFSFNGYGVSRRQFEAYVEKVKTKFSDIETDDSDIKYFEAKNNNGDEIELSYYTEIQVRVTKKLADIQ